MNSTFYNNKADERGGAIYYDDRSMRTYLYHCTFDNNSSPQGNAILNMRELYVYNCLFTGDRPQVIANLLIGYFLLEGFNCTRDQVFGSNQYNPQT
jgi:hypothetical protein